MSTKKAVAVVAACGLLVFMCLSPVYAEEKKEQPIPEMEKEQMDDSAKPDVDPGASKGTDEPIPEQEEEGEGEGEGEGEEEEEEEEEQTE